MNHEKEINEAILEAGVDFGMTGRNGADNSYKAYNKIIELIEVLKKEQGITES